jgi:hypothetical protein
MLPPSARRTINSTVSNVTSFTKASLSFSGRALWIISTSAFLIGVPWALAYAEEEQYIQMEREQGMIKGANEVSFAPFGFLLDFPPHNIESLAFVLVLCMHHLQSSLWVSLTSRWLENLAWLHNIVTLTILS